MTKYLIKRILHGLASVVVVVGIVMLLIYSALDRQLIFAMDPTYKQLGNNQKTAYMYRRWAEYGYLDYVPYTTYLQELTRTGEIAEEQRAELAKFGKKPANDSEEIAAYVKKFTETYEAQGFTVIRLDAKMQSAKKYVSGGQQQLFAYKDRPLLRRLWEYFTGIISVDNIHYVKEDIGERGLTFTLHDPVYGGERFAPAVLGNGTRHKYLLYTTNTFPFIGQNLVQINLGKSYSVNLGIDVFDTMNSPQGSYVLSNVTYPTGLSEMSADDLHTAVYIAGSREGNMVNVDRFTDDYTSVFTKKNAKSRVGFTIVFITHDLGVVANVADRVAVMYAGQIVELGKVDEVFFDPRHPYTWALLSSLPQLAQKNTVLYSITGTPPSLYNKIVGDPFAPRNPYCMKIDTLVDSPMFQVTETHFAKTWLLDPRAPKVEKSEIIHNIHEKLIQAFNI